MLQRRGVIDLFTRQYGVASVRQLVQLDVPASSVWSATRAGTVTRLLRGVVALAPQADDFEARAMALHLVGDGRGHLSGQTAGRLAGLRQMRPVPVEYTIDVRYRMHVPRWARLVRSSWPDGEPRRARPDGLVVASPLRMLFELASQLPQARFERAAEDAWHLGLVSPSDAAAYLARIRQSGRRGVATFDQWLQRASTWSRPAATGLEQLLAELARRAGLPEPVRQYPLRLLDGSTIHLDLAWPDRRLALEPGHSWWHGGDRRQRLDQERDRACGEIGWHVMRFDESVWHRRTGITGQIRRTYLARPVG
jgi:very-short-patch-repair endonuclease